MLELYRRHVWTDAKTINAICSGCLSKNSKMVMAACKFMLDLEIDKDEVEDDAEADEDKKIEIRKQMGTQMPKKKKDALRKMLKLLERKNRRKHRTNYQKNFFPIDLVYDPQGFTEKLFAKLSKGKGKKKELKGEAAVLALSLVSKMIGRHKLIIPEFFSYANHAIKTKNKNVARYLLSIAEACHDTLQRDDVKDVVNTIIDNMISEHCPPEPITMGLNAIREISLRMPNVLDEQQLAYLCQFKDFKNRYVQGAAKSVINAYRDINPLLLPAKLRGMEKNDENEGVTDKAGKVAGLELLQNEEGKNILTEKILDETDLKKMKLLKLKENAKAMGGVKERKDALDIIREQISNLRNEYLTKPGEARSDEVSENDENDSQNSEENPENVENDSENNEENNEENEEENVEENENEENGEDLEEEILGSNASGNEEENDEEENDEEEDDSDESGDEYKEIIGARKRKLEEKDNENEENSDNENSDENIEENSENDDIDEDEIEKAFLKHDNQAENNEGENVPKTLEEAELEADLDEEEEEEDDALRNQGFLTIDDISTFKKSGKERIQEQLAAQVKEKHRKHVKKKTGSSTNFEKLKNKPYMMVLPKKRNEILRAKYKSVKERIRDLKKKSQKIRKGKLKLPRKIYVKA